jgi:hypothetical protein
VLAKCNGRMEIARRSPRAKAKGPAFLPAPAHCRALRLPRGLYLAQPAMRRTCAFRDRSRSFRSASAVLVPSGGGSDQASLALRQSLLTVARPPGGSVTVLWCLLRFPTRPESLVSLLRVAPRESGHPSARLSLHLRFARLIPGGTCEACFPILLRASLPSLQVTFFVSFQRFPSVPSRQKRPSDERKLRLETESHKADSAKLSTGSRLHGG